MSLLHTLLLGQAPLSLADWLQLLVHFASLSLLAVGGAITTVPDMQRLVVDQRAWLSDGEFSGCIALGQAAPGPNVLFVAVIGFSIGGLAGVLATLGGTLAPSAVLAVKVARWSERHSQARGLRALSQGLAPVTVGLLLATGWILLEPVVMHWQALALVAGTIWLMLRTKRSPVWAVAAGAVAGAAGWV
jgi:chromate transporter